MLIFPEHEVAYPVAGVVRANHTVLLAAQTRTWRTFAFSYQFLFFVVLPRKSVGWLSQPMNQ